MTAETICVAATGPSLTRADLDLCPWPILAVNDAWELAPHARWLFASDLRWWEARWRQALAFRCPKWTRDRQAAWRFDLHYIESRDAPGLSTERHLIHEGCNSGYMAINLAMHFGARRVILLGFDAKGTSHFFGKHSERGLPDRHDYSDLGWHFGRMHPERYGLQVVNCTRDTSLTCFKTAVLEDIVHEQEQGRYDQRQMVAHQRAWNS